MAGNVTLIGIGTWNGRNIALEIGNGCNVALENVGIILAATEHNECWNRDGNGSA